jgi:hypothetical protein
VPSIPGNAVTVAVGKQSAKGTPQATPAYKLKLTGGDIGPQRDLLTLAETDASRQAGAQVVVGAHVEGTTEHYLRPTEFASIAYYALGANADSGSTNYTHTATAASSGPYITMYKAINSTTLVDQYSDMRVNTLTVRGGAGQALTYSVAWTGLVAVLGATDPVLTATTETPLVYPNVTCTKGGSAPGTIDSFELTVDQNASYIQGDSGLAAVDSVWGQFAVTGSLSLLFTSDADYRAFNTGTTSGTNLSTTVFNESLTILAQINTNLSVSFVMSQVEYTAYPVPINVDGSPIRVAATFRAKPQAVIANTLSIVTKNQTATAP